MILSTGVMVLARPPRRIVCEYAYVVLACEPSRRSSGLLLFATRSLKRVIAKLSLRTSPSAVADPAIQGQGFLQPLSASRTVPGPDVIRRGQRLTRLHDWVCHQSPLRVVRDGMGSPKLNSLLAARRRLVRIAQHRSLKIKPRAMKYVLLMSVRAPRVDALHVHTQSCKEVFP